MRRHLNDIVERGTRGLENRSDVAQNLPRLRLNSDRYRASCRIQWALASDKNQSVRAQCPASSDLAVSGWLQ